VAAKKDENALELEVAGHEVRLTHPEKIFFPKIDATKQDLLDYYLAIGEPIMRSMGGRPVLLQRFPNGVGGNSFFQKRIPDSAPEWLETTTVSTPNGTESRALVIGDLAHVVWAMNMGCLGFHVWPVLAADAEHTDELRIDLDPQPGTTFDQVREAAHEVKRLLDDVGLTGWPKTTGSRGLHVYVQLEPRWDSYDVRYAAVAVARELARRRPDLITDAWWKEERGERIFIDFNQNAPHKTVFGAWSVRSRVMGPVSTPIGWDEIDTVQPDELTLFAVPERVATGGDPWADKPATAQSLEPLLALHEQDRANGLLDAPWPPEYPKRDDEPTRVAPSRAKKPD
jgi:DNA ligase D